LAASLILLRNSEQTYKNLYFLFVVPSLEYSILLCLDMECSILCKSSLSFLYLEDYHTSEASYELSPLLMYWHKVLILVFVLHFTPD